jgi:hypothetical protein
MAAVLNVWTFGVAKKHSLAFERPSFETSPIWYLITLNGLLRISKPFGHLFFLYLLI